MDTDPNFGRYWQFFGTIINVRTSSSSRSVSVYRWRAYSRAVVFHTLHIGQRDTRLCPYLINCATFYALPLPHIRESSVLTPLLYSSSPSSSASSAAAVVSIYPARSMPDCFHYRIPTRSPLLPLRRLTEVQKRLRSNILCDCILPSLNVCIHWIKHCLRSCGLRQGLLPLPY